MVEPAPHPSASVPCCAGKGPARSTPPLGPRGVSAQLEPELDARSTNWLPSVGLPFIQSPDLEQDSQTLA